MPSDFLWNGARRVLRSKRCAAHGMVLPRHQYEPAAHADAVDYATLGWLYGTYPEGTEPPRPERYRDMDTCAPEYREMPEVVLRPGLLPAGDTLEIGVGLGASSHVAACRARWLSQQGQHTTHWMIDPFGRVGQPYEEEPFMELAFAHLRAERLHNYCAWLPGTVETVGTKLADSAVVSAYLAGRYFPNWARKDLPFANRVVCPGGYIAVFGLHVDDRHAGYGAAVRETAADLGLKVIRDVEPPGAICIFQKPGYRAGHCHAWL